MGKVGQRKASSDRTHQFPDNPPDEGTKILRLFNGKFSILIEEADSYHAMWFYLQSGTVHSYLKKFHQEQLS